MSQFYFNISTQDEETKEDIEVQVSFDAKEVLKTVQTSKDNFLIILKDGHEESKVTHTDKHGVLQKQRQWVSSQFVLDRETFEKFKEFEQNLNK